MIHVFGFHPSSRGFGWILLESADTAFDWGTSDIEKDKNRKALARVEDLFDRYRPDILALETSEGGRRIKRVRELYRAVIKAAERHGIDVRSYSREQINLALSGTKIITRDALAKQTAIRLTQIQTRVPRPRNAWNNEHPNSALLSAAACALTYFASHQPNA